MGGLSFAFYFYFWYYTENQGGLELAENTPVQHTCTVGMAGQALTPDW